MSVQSDLEKSMAEERAAAEAYRYRAFYAHEEGDEVSVKLWQHIAEEEDGHYNEFKDRLAALRAEEEDIYREVEVDFTPQPRFADYATPGDIQYPPQEAPRPFPQTYSDWLVLAADIKQKEPKLEVWTKVNDCLNYIALDELGVDDAKHWLMEKAGELGVS